jgi:hypothetical protein
MMSVGQAGYRLARPSRNPSSAAFHAPRRDSTKPKTGPEVLTRKTQLIPAQPDVPARPDNERDEDPQLDRNTRRLGSQDIPDDVSDRDRRDQTEHNPSRHWRASSRRHDCTILPRHRARSSASSVASSRSRRRSSDTSRQVPKLIRMIQRHVVADGATISATDSVLCDARRRGASLGRLV